MRDDTYREKLDTVKHILESFDEDDLDPDDTDQLLEDGLEHVSAARELLDVGSGKIVRVTEDDGEIREESLELEEKK